MYGSKINSKRMKTCRTCDLPRATFGIDFCIHGGDLWKSATYKSVLRKKGRCRKKCRQIVGKTLALYSKISKKWISGGRHASILANKFKYGVWRVADAIYTKKLLEYGVFQRVNAIDTKKHWDCGASVSPHLTWIFFGSISLFIWNVSAEILVCQQFSRSFYKKIPFSLVSHCIIMKLEFSSFDGKGFFYFRKPHLKRFPLINNFQLKLLSLYTERNRP